ncbi:paraquat-inducible protein A [Paraburkholderia rhynchosiae]|uniref:Intermembrane transport protein PqiA n=1 Tax=Paraburkholderia rhynchosiae TaxID=487049 RepID=A0A2N7WSK0_9BURK|nr:paraquat-inducible protein A [Paraburkholderia rhynchosiae]PMS32321.1 paraquat-inducible membrane protein A [Paraburkholderia rhynchosiae]CAB3731994.1 Intermembrane transport protein PqiA [Paraburkholderia rhynchosiae]
MKTLTASNAGLLACHACARVAPGAAHAPCAPREPKPRRRTQHCEGCGALLHRRNPDSVSRTWALLISAALLYIPANLLPVMHTSSLVGSEDDTIISGVIYFWTSGSWPLAIVVFVASILVPMLKLSVLVLLTATAQRRSAWRPIERVKLYRIVERIGRWSMLDVFVITLTVALVRFESLAVITAGPGALAFGCVVVLTMLASMKFDPRLIWDSVEGGSPDAARPALETHHE